MSDTSVKMPSTSRGRTRGASRSLQPALAVRPLGDSSPVGFAEVETSLKWLCACKLQFQTGTPPLLLLTSPPTSAQFPPAPRNPRVCTELCCGSECTADYKEHSTGYSKGPSFPSLWGGPGGARTTTALYPGAGRKSRGAQAAWGWDLYSKKRWEVPWGRGGWPCGSDCHPPGSPVLDGICGVESTEAMPGSLVNGSQTSRDQLAVSLSEFSGSVGF